jgi:hypothetical protein
MREVIFLGKVGTQRPLSGARTTYSMSTHLMRKERTHRRHTEYKYYGKVST